MRTKLAESQSFKFDLHDPDHAYLFGFIQADGHLRRIKGTKGALAVELGVQDKFILEKFVDLIPVYSSITTRKRKTNFKEEYVSVQWTAYDWGFRQHLIALGMPEGRKSAHVAPPLSEFSKPDYYRGWIDADGALGLTFNGFPFLTFTTSSEAIAQNYIAFIEEVTGKLKTTSRNSRDGIFNIAVYKEDAQQLIAVIYYDNCLALPRKAEKARQLVNWIRPATMRKVEGRKRWTEEEDRFIVSHTIKESAEAFDRSEKSVNVRRWRLRNDLV